MRSFIPQISIVPTVLSAGVTVLSKMDEIPALMELIF